MIIKDVIHRFVSVPNLCQKFIDTFEFNRLRRIKQLGLVSHIYPSASHTRFEHSIGVMHLAGKVCDVISVKDREKELIQLAGLLHDVGHVAYSHLTDYILMEKEIKEEISHHEQRSIFILREINKRFSLLTDKEVEFVKKCILGEYMGEEKPYLYQIVNNRIFGVDVDRLDYLQRDMYHLGMPCFQADYIINCIRINNNNLSLLEKARSEVEAMYEARKRLLCVVCRHKTVMKCEKIIREALEQLSISESWFAENWLKMDDYRMYYLMSEKCPDLLEKIDTRQWDEIDLDERFRHINTVKREEIEEQIEKVIWS